MAGAVLRTVIQTGQGRSSVKAKAGAGERTGTDPADMGRDMEGAGTGRKLGQGHAWPPCGSSGRDWVPHPGSWAGGEAQGGFWGHWDHLGHPGPCQ